MMHIRIGNVVVPLEQCVLQIGTETGGGLGVMVIYQTQIIHTFFESREPEEYKACRDFMSVQVSLHDYNLQMTRQSILLED